MMGVVSILDARDRVNALLLDHWRRAVGNSPREEHRLQPTRRFETGLAALLLALYVAFFASQTPTLFESTLTPTEIDAHLAAMEKHMVAPDEAKRQFVADMRAWGAADDGHPVYMVNLLRYHAALQRWPGGPE